MIQTTEDVDVFINSKRRIPMPSYFEYRIVDEADAIDENGCLKDKHSVRVSLRDALASRNQQDDVAARQAMSDAEHRVADYLEWQRHGFYSRPGFRYADSQMERDDRRTVLAAAYADAEKANAEAWKRLGGPNTAVRGNSGTGWRGSRLGDPCSVNGASGFLEYGDDGELVCRISNQESPGPEEATSDRALNDARREAAYDSYSRYVQNAWRMT
jgi:hypothetical protein